MRMSLSTYLTRCCVVFLIFLVSGLQLANADQDVFKVGMGKADITGPVAQVVLVGYADPGHIGSGLLNRLYCRAFVIEDYTGNSVLLVHLDSHSVPIAIHEEVLRQLYEKYDGLYNNQNVILHSQHTHSTSSGAHTDRLWYIMFAFGFRKEYFTALVEEILKAVGIAHSNKVASRLLLSQSELKNGASQRSLEAYMANPEKERAMYSSNTNTLMTIIKIVDAKNDSLRALMSYFPVHTTSFTQHQNMISPDNKGYAQWLLERKYPGIFAAFFQTNHGDTSPNLVDNGDGTFNGEGRSDVEHAQIIGQRQADVAELAVQGKLSERVLSGKVYAKGQYFDFADAKLANGKRTCTAMVGVAALAGTEDGRGGLNREMAEASAFTSLKAKIAHFLATNLFSVDYPDEATVKCQGEKLPLLAVGSADPPMTPHILPLKTMAIGQLLLVALPFEATTMAGRRIQRDLTQVMAQDLKIEDPIVEILSLCNGYAGYLTTREEYSKQHYEGASTHFGPHQLEVTQNKLVSITKALQFEAPLKSLILPLKVDLDSLFVTPFASSLLDSKDPPTWMKYGKVTTDTDSSLYTSGSVISATYWCAFPANSQAGIVTSFCDVQKYNTTSKTYSKFLGDNDWNVRFIWRRAYLYYSTCTCQWIVEQNSEYVASGQYQIALNGAYHDKSGKVVTYKGFSRKFFVQVEKSGLDNYDVSMYANYIPDELLAVIALLVAALTMSVRIWCC